MRLNEFADAQAQLDLLRIIIDNTWSAIAQQAEEQKRAEAERKAQAKLIPKSKKTSKASITRTPITASIKIKKMDDRLMKQQPPAVLKLDPNASKAVKPLPLTNPQPKKPPANTAIIPKLVATPPLPRQKKPPPQAKTEVSKQAKQQMAGSIVQQQPNATTPQAAQLQQSHATQQPLTPQQMRLQRQTSL